MTYSLLSLREESVILVDFPQDSLVRSEEWISCIQKVLVIIIIIIIIIIVAQYSETTSLYLMSLGFLEQMGSPSSFKNNIKLNIHAQVVILFHM